MTPGSLLASALLAVASAPVPEPAPAPPPAVAVSGQDRPAAAKVTITPVYHSPITHSHAPPDAAPLYAEGIVCEVPFEPYGFGPGYDGDGTIPFVLKPEIGFAYLQPRWDRGLGAVADPEDLDYGAVFYPRLEFTVNYGEPPDARTFVVSASYLDLEGDLDRQVTQTDGSARAEAENELELLVADLVGRRWPAQTTQYPPRPSCCEAVVAIRYASLDQRFRSTLTSGTAIARELTATQSFSGLGVSGGGGLRLPLEKEVRPGTDPLTLYGNARGSLLIGENRKTSTLRSEAAGTITLQQEGRDLIPVGEVEVGLAWGTAPVPSAWRYAAANLPPPILGIRVAAIGQVWGDVGYISAARPPLTRFDGGNLYLYGALVTFYLKQ